MDRKAPLRTTRQSRRRYVDEVSDTEFRRLSTPYVLAHQFYTSMLLQDVRYAFPFPSFHEAFEAKLTNPGDSGNLTEMVAQALEPRDGYRRSLAEALQEFAERCASHMVGFGEAAYEIVYEAPSDAADWETFELAPVHPYRRVLGRDQHYLVPSGSESPRWIRLHRRT